MNAFDAAAAALEAAKIEEAKATAKRLDAEQMMLALMPARDEGSASERGLHYRVTVRYGVNRSVDVAALESARHQIAAPLFEQAIGYKPEIRLAGLRYLQNNEPEVYAILAQAITAKPAKPSVSIERVTSATREAA